jgi:hypothetical protein
MRRALWLAVLVGAASTAAAQESQSQFLPEVDAFFKATPSGRILALGGGTLAQGASDDDNGYVGLYWDQHLSDRVSVRGGYRFQYTGGEPVQRDSRIQLSADLRFPVSWRLLATDRNMVELRWINGDPSQRYRNRLSVEREYVGLLGKAHTFVGSAEFFYDTRYDAWNHQEYTASVETLVSQRLQVELYYQRQNDSRSSPAHVNALGLTVTLFLDARKPAATGVVIDPGK